MLSATILRAIHNIRIPAGLTVLLALGTGCTQSSESDKPADAVSGVAYLDEAAGVITLPADQYFLRPEERRDMVSASGVMMIDCVEAKGLKSSIERRRVIPDNEVNLIYGLWRLEDAERYGYVTPESAEKLGALERNARASADPMPEGELRARQECGQDPELQQFGNPSSSGAWNQELSSVSIAARESEEWAQVVDDWTQCLSKVGVSVGEDQSVEGLDYEAIERREVTESDVKIAVADVTCKREVDYIQRLADLDAAAQAPVIAKYRDEMIADRQRLDELVSRARQVLADAAL